jgi:hypothetical protein
MAFLRLVFFTVGMLLPVRSAFGAAVVSPDWCALSLDLRNRVGREIQAFLGPAAQAFLEGKPSRNSLRLFALATLEDALGKGESASAFHAHAFDESKRALEMIAEGWAPRGEVSEFTYPSFDELVAQSFLAMLENLWFSSVLNEPGERSEEQRLSVQKEVNALKDRMAISYTRVLQRARFFGRFVREGKITAASATRSDEHPRIKWALEMNSMGLSDRFAANGLSWLYISRVEKQSIAIPRLSLGDDHRMAIANFDVSNLHAESQFRNIITITGSLRNLFSKISSQLAELSNLLLEEESESAMLREQAREIGETLGVPWEQCLEFMRTHGDTLLSDRLQAAAELVKKVYADKKPKGAISLPVLQEVQ